MSIIFILGSINFQYSNLFAAESIKNFNDTIKARQLKKFEETTNAINNYIISNISKKDTAVFKELLGLITSINFLTEYASMDLELNALTYHSDFMANDLPLITSHLESLARHTKNLQADASLPIDSVFLAEIYLAYYYYLPERLAKYWKPNNAINITTILAPLAALTSELTSPTFATASVLNPSIGAIAAAISSFGLTLMGHEVYRMRKYLLALDDILMLVKKNRGPNSRSSISFLWGRMGLT